MHRKSVLTVPLALVAALLIATIPILRSGSPAYAASEVPVPVTTSELHDRVVPPLFCYTILVFVASTVSYDDQGRPIYDPGGDWIYHWVCEVPVEIASNAAEAYVEMEESINSGYRDAAEAVVDAIIGLFD